MYGARRDRHGQYAGAGSTMKFSQLAVPGRGGGLFLERMVPNLYDRHLFFER